MSLDHFVRPENQEFLKKKKEEEEEQGNVEKTLETMAKTEII